MQLTLRRSAPGSRHGLRAVLPCALAIAAVALAGCVGADRSPSPRPSAWMPAGSLDDESPSPTASPSASPTSTPTQEATPTPAPPLQPTPRPTLPPGTVLAKADVSIQCGTGDLGNFLTVDGPSIYIDCPSYGDNGAILVVDAASGRLLKKLPLARMSDLKAIDHGIWVDWSRACTAGSACPSFLERLDPATGRASFHLDGRTIAAHGLGYVWLLGPTGQVTKIDTATLATSTIPFKSWPTVACGSLFGSDDAGYHRFDPATGGLLADIPGSKGIVFQDEVGGQCWGSVTDNNQGAARFVRIGASAVEFEGAWIPGPTRIDVDGKPHQLAPDLLVLDGAFWVRSSIDADRERLQQVDPASGKLLGTAWVIPFSGTIAAAGGRIWITNEVGESLLQRLNVSSAPLRPSTSPSTSSTEGPQSPAAS